MDDALKQVYGIFAEEAGEVTEALSSELLAMEAGPAAIEENIESFYRQAHNLKGSAASLGMPDVADLAHHMETALLPVRRRETLLDPSLIDVCLQALRAIAMRARGLASGTSDGEEEIRTATVALLAVIEPEEGCEESAAEPAAESAPAEPVEPAELPAGEPTASGPAPAEEVARLVAAAEAEAATTTPQVTSSSVRVPLSRVEALEARLAEFRGMRRSLEHGAQLSTELARQSEQLWRAALYAERRAVGMSQFVSSTQLQELRQRSLRLGRELRELAETSELGLAELDDNLRAIRVVGAGSLQTAANQALRDACRQTTKEARLLFVGAETQIDSRLLENLRNPIIHMVRNAADHGLEPPEQRLKGGKSRTGTVILSVDQRGNQIIIEVHDDGRGIDPEAIRLKAIHNEFLSPARANGATVEELHELLFRPGFSTAERVTDLSGRGVGLDAVRDAILKLHGRVELNSTLGKGTTCRLIVPLTLAITETVCVEDGGHLFSIALSAVEQVVRLPESDVVVVDEQTFLKLDNEMVPVLRLSSLLGHTERIDGGFNRVFIVLAFAGRRFALQCAHLDGMHELVVRPLPPELKQIPLLGGVALKGNGKATFQLSPRSLLDAFENSAVERAESPEERAAAYRGARILIADDALTTRSLVRAALEAAGFSVRTAVDGEQALQLAMTEPFDLVVSDIRMPKLDGYALTEALRRNPRTTRVPVVLFSRLSTEEGMERGTASGANAYLTKTAFDRGQLLDVISRVLRER